jgi:hypothetical protein
MNYQQGIQTAETKVFVPATKVSHHRHKNRMRDSHVIHSKRVMSQSHVPPPSSTCQVGESVVALGILLSYGPAIITAEELYYRKKCATTNSDAS